MEIDKVIGMISGSKRGRHLYYVVVDDVIYHHFEFWTATEEMMWELYFSMAAEGWC